MFVHYYYYPDIELHYIILYLNNRKVKLNQTQFEFELFSNDIF